jgi:hypothetical protein
LKARRALVLVLRRRWPGGGQSDKVRLRSFGNRRKVARLAATTKNSGDIYYSKAVLVYKGND